MARPARFYLPASALALAGMVCRMGWIGETQLEIAAAVACMILGVGLLLGIVGAVTWVFISVVSLIFSRTVSPPGPASPGDGFTRDGGL